MESTKGMTVSFGRRFGQNDPGRDDELGPNSGPLCARVVGLHRYNRETPRDPHDSKAWNVAKVHHPERGVDNDLEGLKIPGNRFSLSLLSLRKRQPPWLLGRVGLSGPTGS